MMKTCLSCDQREPTSLRKELAYHGQRRSPCAMWTPNARSKLRNSTCWRRRPTMPRGPVRRGQLISPFGPGAMMILPDGVSVICGGLDHWFKHESGDAENIDQ